MPFLAANAWTALALPGPQRIGLTTSPVIKPSSSVSNLLEEHVVDAKEPCHRLDLNGQRRRTEDDGVTAGHVGTHNGAHLGVDTTLDVLDEQALTEFVEIAEGVAVQHASALADQVLETRSGPAGD